MSRPSFPKGSLKGLNLPKKSSPFPKSQSDRFYESVRPTTITGSTSSPDSKESVKLEDRIYDESERCINKIHTVHETNQPHGKVIAWEAKDAKGVSTITAKSGLRSPLIKFTVRDGRRHGRYREYYPSGVRKFETRFHMDTETGPRQIWNEQGQPTR